MVTASSIRKRAIADRIARGDRVDEYFSRKNDGQAWTIGRLAIANRDAVLFQAVSIELLLRNAIDARPNSSLLELQDILNKIQELRAMLVGMVAETPPDQLRDHDLLQEQMRALLKRYFRKTMGRRPMILPVILEM